MTALIQRSFSGGEITPALYGRADVTKFATGLRKMRNYLAGRQGGAYNRPGTTYIGEVKDSSTVKRLIEFVFNSENTYVIELGNLYARFYRNGAQITVSGVSAWSNATAYEVGDLASRLGVNYYCILAHTNQQPPNATYWYPLTGSIFEIPTPWVTADLSTLQYAQSGDIITIVHPSYRPRNLNRAGHTDWTLTNFDGDVPSIATPANFTQGGGTPGGIATSWALTAVNVFGEESLAAIVASTDTPSGGSPIDLNWDEVTDAVEYRIYREFSSSLTTGLIATVSGTFFQDIGDIAESGIQPQVRSLFTSSNDYPSAVAYSQQRLLFGNTNNEPTTVWSSRIGSFTNFLKQFPVIDSGPVEFSLVGKQVSEIVHLLELRQLLALTTGSEWAINGDSAGVLRPTDINAKQQSFNGATTLRPLIVNGSALYVQARGSIIRDLAFDFQSDGYSGNDLTIFSSHLFDGYTLVDWAYQQIPNSTVWCVRSDGKLLGVTYIREQQVLAWHRHDFENGTVENVIVVPEGNEDALYLIIKRTINGSTKRYIERMESRFFSDIYDAVFLDSCLEYDGRHTGSVTMTLSGGTNWNNGEQLTLTASSPTFSAGDVGNEFRLTGTDGTIIKCTVEVYSSTTVVTVRVDIDVPVAMRNAAIATWAEAVDQLSGLSHLEGEDVAVFADGYVVASPHNEDYDIITVTSGAITLPRPYARIRVGLPITADIETLDLENPQGETLADKHKRVGGVAFHVENTRGLFVGGKAPEEYDETINTDDDPLFRLIEKKLRQNEPYDSPITPVTEVVEINIDPAWNSNGRVFVRQVDPIPVAILSVAPIGDIPIR